MSQEFAVSRYGFVFPEQEQASRSLLSATDVMDAASTLLGVMGGLRYPAALIRGAPSFEVLAKTEVSLTRREYDALHAERRDEWRQWMPHVLQQLSRWPKQRDCPPEANLWRIEASKAWDEDQRQQNLARQEQISRAKLPYEKVSPIALKPDSLNVTEQDLAKLKFPPVVRTPLPGQSTVLINTKLRNLPTLTPFAAQKAALQGQRRLRQIQQVQRTLRAQQRTQAVMNQRKF